MFNPQQLEAINSDASHILCLAGAGAGKTACFVERIHNLIMNKNVAPHRILALTFTNAAALEMKTRFKKKWPECPCPEFKTFHGFCYSLIIKDVNIRNAIGYAQIPAITTDAQMKRIKEEAKLQLGIKLSDDKLTGKVALNRQETEELELFNKRVKKMLKKENLVTFDIMCYDVADLFIKKDPVTDTYKQRYMHILTDEFQDTDMRQLKFLSSFNQSNFYFCGDALQSIYQFRNCTNEPLKLFAKDPNWTVIKLYENYRSSNQIVAFANKMSKYAEAQYRIEMHGQFDSDDVIVQYGSSSSFYDPVDTGHIKDVITRLKKIEEGTSAVLCRTNREASAIKAAFDEAGINYKLNNNEDHTFEVLDSVLDDQYMLDWLSTFLVKEKYAEYLRLASQEEKPDIHWFAKTYKDVKEINKYGKLVVEIRKIINSMTVSNQNMKELATKILEKLKKPEVIDSLDVMMLIELNTVSELLEYLKTLLAETKEVSCYVGTIHSVKGLEYDNVFIMGVDDKMFKLDCEEEKNIYYVAITRAKKHLVVYRY